MYVDYDNILDTFNDIPALSPFFLMISSSSHKQIQKS